MVTTTSPVFSQQEVLEQKELDAPALALESFDQVPEGMEWVDGQWIEKTGMTLNHSAAQGNLVREWGNYTVFSGQRGKVYPEAPCQTDRQKRRPDVAYLTPGLLQQLGQPAILPQSFPLIAEVASPDDCAEDLFSKAREYLRSGCQEVWLLFPENQLVMIATADKWLVFSHMETVSTQTVLQGFTISVAELFA
jgi:Uma2 family endonuclease